MTQVRRVTARCRAALSDARRRYGQLLRYATPYRAGWVLLLVVSWVSTLATIAQPWLMQIVVDHVLGDAPMPPALARAVVFLPGAETPFGLLAWLAVAGVGLFGISSAADAILTFGWIRVGQRMVYRLASDMFARVQRRSLPFHSRNSVGDSIARITGDSWCVYTLADRLLLTPVQALITIAALTVIMAHVDLTLTLLAFAVAPLMTATSLLLGGRLRGPGRAWREIEARIHAHVQQTLSGIPVVQAFSREELERHRLEELTTAAIRAQRRSTVAESVYGLGSGIAATIGTAAILWLGTRQVLAGELTAGSLLVFLAYLTSLQGEIGNLTGVYGALQSARGRADRVLDVLEADREVEDRPGAHVLPRGRGHVQIDGVTFGYEPERPVLRGVSLEVLPGETVAIVGTTGAGKSTLVSLVPRFFDPSSGRVRIDGHDVREVQLRSVRAQVAVVLQEAFLFPMTVAENIAYGRPDAPREEIEAAARAANAAGFIERLPDGYDTIVGERGATLSGGERQRIAIARALLKDAPILILDEPTSALDAETERLLLEAIERLAAGRTTLMIAHRLSTVRQAHRIVVLQDGAIAEMGTHRELLARGGFYAGLHRRSARQRRASVSRR